MSELIQYQMSVNVACLYLDHGALESRIVMKGTDIFLAADVHARDREILLALQCEGPLHDEYDTSDAERSWTYSEWLMERLRAQLQVPP